MMTLQDIEVEVREPTGLALGTFDLFVVRQKIYEGQLAPTCEFKDAKGKWVPLAQRAEFSDIYWLRGESTEDKTMRKRRSFGGWQTKSAEASEASDELPSLDLDSDGRRGGLRSITEKLRTQGLPKSGPKKDGQ
jgi:hypothetical protein